MYQRFNWELWKKFGGETGSEPYVDFVTAPNGREHFRGFCDADFFHEWDAFKGEALKVAKAHLLKADPLHEGQFVHKPYAEPIATRPMYLIEVFERERFDILWLNIAIKNEAEFSAAKAAGNLKRQEIREAIKRYGSPLWQYQVESFQTTKYRSTENEPDDNDEVMQLLKRNGIR